MTDLSFLLVTHLKGLKVKFHFQDAGADTGGGGDAEGHSPPSDRFREGRSPPLNLEFFVPCFRIASQACLRERNPSEKEEKYLS